MRRFLFLAVMCGLALPAMAFGQETGQPEPPKEAADDIEAVSGEETPAPGASATEEMPEPPKEAADDIEAQYGDVTSPEEVLGADREVLVGTEEDSVRVAAAGEEPVEEGHQHPFLDGLSWQLMASAFYMFNGYRVSGPYNDLEPAPDARSFYPYTNYMGFGLNFAGGDVMYTGEKFAVRLDLRFGTGAELLTPIAPVKQAYASWLPHERISIDVGFFDTIYGAEVVDEWQNANYTRGALYFLRQPFNHAGLRFGAEVGDIVGLTLMLTNGTVFGGTPIDDNQVPAVGWQIGLSPDGHRSVRRRGLRDGYREVGLFIGGNHAPNGLNGNRDWNSFFDLVLSLNFDWFTLLLNGDYFVDRNEQDLAARETVFTYGHSLALIFDVSDHWSIGLRGEHLSGNEAYRNFGGPINPDLNFGFLWTGTLTLRYKPVEYLVLSLEGRLEGAGEQIYYSRSSPTIMDPDTMEEILEPNKKIWWGLIVGATAHIGN